MSETVVVAVGGNALIQDADNVTVPAQYHAARQTAQSLSALISSGKRLAIVHGNGPQVGFILRRSELSHNFLHDVPLDSCVADTQGAIGYNLQMALRNELKIQGLESPVATIITQVLVDRADPAFTHPVKPIGSFMEASEAEKKSKEEGWDVREDSGRGWRRVVASPVPQKILELETIRLLLDSGVLTVAVGGGGIPVAYNEQGELEGVEAVIDKDKAASLFACSLKADCLVISTAVPRVCVNFGRPNQRDLDRLSIVEAETLIKEGQFAPGSMLPKIEAMIDFVKTTGNEGIITDPFHLAAAMEGKEGTRIVP